MIKFIYGTIFIILGIAGIILPILPGIPFLIIGGFLLGVIPKDMVLKILKKLKLDEKDSKLNKMLNYLIIKYVYSKEFSLKK